MSTPFRKKIDLEALGVAVTKDRGDVHQAVYVQAIGGGWTASNLSKLENNRLRRSLTWELAEALRLRLGELPLVDHDPAAALATGAATIAALMADRARRAKTGARRLQGQRGK